MQESRVIFLDTETTGLDIERHEVWEFGAVVYSNPDVLDSEDPIEVNLVWEPTWLEYADPNAIKVNRYYQRTHEMTQSTEPLDTSGYGFSDPYEAAKYIAYLCENAIVIGNNPGFDEMFLTKLCREQSQVFANFHRKHNVSDIAYGMLTAEHAYLNRHGGDLERIDAIADALTLPVSTSKLLDLAGCPKNTGTHTAIGDARHVRDAWFHLGGY